MEYLRCWCNIEASTFAFAPTIAQKIKRIYDEDEEKDGNPVEFVREALNVHL